MSSETTGAETERKKAARRFWWVGVSYFAEGLPWSLLHQVAAEFFTAIGARPSQVGRTALLHIPILLKMVMSPVVEGVSTLRRWMLTTQLLMGIMGGVAVLAHGIAIRVDPTAAESPLLWVLLFSIGILSAVYDIACDGFYLEHLDTQQQARYSGIRVAIYRAAMLLGSFLLVFLGGLFNWLVGFGVGALLLIGLSVALSLVLPRGHGQADTVSLSLHPRSKRGSYLSFFRQESVLLVVAFLFFYKAADAMMFSMSSVLLSRELGINTELRATMGIFSTVASIWGAIWGGAWIAKRGFEKSVFPITFLMVVTEPLYALLALGSGHLGLGGSGVSGLEGLSWTQALPQLSIVTAVLVIEKLCGGLAVAAQTIFIMRRCHPDHKTAHYAFATVVYSIAQILLGLGSGYVFESAGPVGYYVIVSLLAIPALVLVRFVPLGQRSRDEI